MDPQGHIYAGTNDEPVLPEDKARLDGYLRGRAEAELKAHKMAVASIERVEALRQDITAEDRAAVEGYLASNDPEARLG